MSMEGELTCPICLHIYQEPVVMSCMHSYCRECLKDLHAKSTTAEESDTRIKSSNTLQCPACRAVTSFGLEGVDGLPKNFTLASICMKFKETSQQSSAKASDGTSEQESSGERKVYCKACQVIVRSGDLFPAHRYHVTEDLETELTKQREKLSTCLQELERSRTRKEARLKAGSVYYCNRQGQMQKQEDAINSLAESLEECLRSRKKEVLEKIEPLKTRNKASFETYQKQLQSYINTVDSITAAAHTICEEKPDGEEGQVGFLQVVDDVLMQTQRLEEMDEVAVTLTLGVSFATYGEVFAENLRTDFRKLLGPSLDPTKITVAPGNEDTLTAYGNDIRPADGNAEQVSWDTIHVLTSNESDADVCNSTTRETLNETESIQKEVSTDEELSAESETGSENSSDAVCCFTHSGAKFEWDQAHCNSSLAISEDCLLVTDERWEDEEIQGECAHNSGHWKNVRGIASNTVLREKNSYWEILVTFAILSHLDDNDLITDLGICKHRKEDVYSPLNKNYYCLCCSLIKDPVSSNIVMEFWDGPKKKTWIHEVKKRIKRNKKVHLNLGFSVNFQNKTFKIIDVNENSVLHRFEDMDFQSVTAVASIENADKVRTSLELNFPSVLWS